MERGAEALSLQPAPAGQPHKENCLEESPSALVKLQVSEAPANT